MSTSAPVLVVGSIALDNIKTPAAEHANLLGGSASYASLAASFLSPVRLVGVVGTDFPQAHRDLFTAHQIDLEGLEVVEGETFRWSGEYEQNMNNRRTLSVALNVFEKFQPKLPTSWKASEYVLLGNIAPSLQHMVFRQCEAPKFVVADTMDLWINLARTDLYDLLKDVDMLILNDSESHLLTGEDNIIRAGRKILERGPRYVAIKKGEHGCFLMSKEEQFFATSAFPLDSISDPTGAGDSFAGGLIGHLARTGDTSFTNLKEAIVQGTIIASFCVEEFSLRRMERLSKSEIVDRRAKFAEYTLVPLPA